MLGLLQTGPARKVETDLDPRLVREIGENRLRTRDARHLLKVALEPMLQCSPTHDGDGTASTRGQP
jgi:hypothetical protein